MELFNIPEVTQSEIEEGRRNWLESLHNDPNRFSYWFRKILSVEDHDVMLPSTVGFNIPDSLFDCFFLEKKTDRRKITDWLKENVMPIIGKARMPLFVKNGNFSNKFDFANSCLLSSNDLEELVNHVCNIQHTGLLFETDGYLELVFRDWIQPEPGTECIYNGMPLRPEMRLFYDFDEHKYLYDVNYWDWDCCHKAISKNPQDLEVYERQYPIISKKLEYRRDMLLPTIIKALEAVTELRGKWSVDFILDTEGAWLIDMALAHRSTYWDPSKVK